MRQRVREMIISTIAGTQTGFFGDGGSSEKAQPHTQYGLFFDATGTLYIADYYNGAVRKVTGLM
jgi:hypothetical protein